MQEIYKGSNGNLRFSAFVPAQNVNAYFDDEARLNEALQLFKASNISKVYFDCLRGGHFPGESVLIKARDFMQSNGLKVAAGLTPTQGTGKADTHAKWWLCYTNAETQKELTEIVKRTAGIFDEIIVDDFLCTHCHCDECRSARGDRDWGKYYRELLAHVAKECIIDPARSENPEIKVIIKYPQWYDRFHVFGYDVQHHPENFDEVWVGTEIRDPLVEYVHQYQAFANYSWLASISGEKIGGAWFDFINCYPEIYVDQAIQSVLAGARELIRFHYDPELYSSQNPNTKALIDAMHELEKLAKLMDGHKPEGIAFYKPVNTDGEDETYILDYLGMLGLPIVPCHKFPDDAKSIFLPIHATDDPDIAEKVMAFVEKGGVAAFSPGFLEKMACDERFLRLAGYANPPITPADLWAFRFSVGGSPSEAESHIHFGANLHPISAELLATASHTSGNVPVLTRHSYGKGKVIVFNAKTFKYPEGSGRVTVGEPVSLPNLHQRVVDSLRSEMLSPFPFDVSVRSRVGVYYYSDILVLTNFNDQAVQVVITSQNPTNGIADDSVTGQKLGEWSEGKLSLSVPRREYVVISLS